MVNKPIITHLSVGDISRKKVFKEVRCYDDMCKGVLKYPKIKTTYIDPNDVDDDTDIKSRSNTMKGNAFEVFTQFFMLYFGFETAIDVYNLKDTSNNEFQRGYDFTHKSKYGKPGHIQVKFKSNSLHSFEYNQLESFFGTAYNHRIKRNQNILFTNLPNTDTLFYCTMKKERAMRSFRLIDRNIQENLIAQHPTFWDDFNECIDRSALPIFKDPYPNRDVQDEIEKGSIIKGYKGTDYVLSGQSPTKKGVVSASTGCGKTQCQFNNINDAFFKYNKDVVTVVQPTISLLTQTILEFYTWKMFGYVDGDNNVYTNNNIHNIDVSCVMIMSGDMPRIDKTLIGDRIKITLSPTEAVKFVAEERLKGRKVLIVTTLMSERTKYSDIIKLLTEERIKIGLELYDEFHNLVSQTTEKHKQEFRAEFLRLSHNRADATLFYSASHKKGSILNTMDENLFGEVLAKITRDDLMKGGYVTPGLKIKFISAKNVNEADVANTNNAAKDGVDLKKAKLEATAIVTAFKDAQTYYSKPNMITFSSKVANSEYIAKDPYMREVLPGVDFHFISADISVNDREYIFNLMKTTGNNVLNQHSVAKEGVNVPGLNCALIGRDLGTIAIQQGIGRIDRALYEDTIKFQNGEISLNDPKGWTKYYSLVYVVIDEDRMESFKERLVSIVKCLMSDLGIDEKYWDISNLEEEQKNGFNSNNNGTTDKDVKHLSQFNPSVLKKMVDEAKIEAVKELEEEEKKRKELFHQMEYNKENDILKNMTDEEWLKYINNN